MLVTEKHGFFIALKEYSQVMRAIGRIEGALYDTLDCCSKEAIRISMCEIDDVFVAIRNRPFLCFPNNEEDVNDNDK